MATTKEEIRQWLDEGKAKGSTHVIVVCDTYDWEDYPVFVLSGQDIEKVIPEYKKNMQKIMEIYCLDEDFDKQLSQYRAGKDKFHF